LEDNAEAVFIFLGAVSDLRIIVSMVDSAVALRINLGLIEGAYGEFAVVFKQEIRSRGRWWEDDAGACRIGSITVIFTFDIWGMVESAMATRFFLSWVAFGEGVVFLYKRLSSSVSAGHQQLLFLPEAW